MKQVSKDEFYRAISELNVSARYVNDKWPYAKEFYVQDRIGQPVIGKTVDREVNGMAATTYFLAA